MAKVSLPAMVWATQKVMGTDWETVTDPETEMERPGGMESAEQLEEQVLRLPSATELGLGAARS